MNPARLAGWVPIRVSWRDARPSVDWCRLGDVRFDEPFFEQTIARCLRHPFNLAFRRQTPIEALGELEAACPGLYPAGLVFHMSRCGSTLVSRMLAALPDSLVISEAGPVDSVLRARYHDPSVTDEQRARWLRGIIGALGQRWHGPERRYILKLDAWHALELPLIERAFPGVPWVFLYRDPVEVLVSHQREPSWMMSAVNAPALLGVDAASAHRVPREEYCARVLARICEAVLEHGGGRGRLIRYRELPDAAWERIPRLFGLALSEADLSRMREAARFDAKRPTRPFEDDATAKQREASAAVREAAARWLASLHQRLEARRQTQEAP
jgi:hypothetical protein